MKSPKPTGASHALLVGGGLILTSLVVLIGFGIYLVSQSNILGSAAVTDAIIFVDVPGRIALDQTLQVDGPAPVPVSAGSHTLTFFDAPTARLPLEVAVNQGEFLYVSNPHEFRLYRPDASRGVMHVAAFPPDTTIEIPDCTPLDAKRPVICKGKHTLSAELSPGDYVVKYVNPHLGEYEETVNIAADSTVDHQYSFINTVADWDEWRQAHGDVIERNYPRYYRHYGAGSAILLPFAASGQFLGELFD